MIVISNGLILSRERDHVPVRQMFLLPPQRDGVRRSARRGGGRRDPGSGTTFQEVPLSVAEDLQRPEAGRVGT